MPLLGGGCHRFIIITDDRIAFREDAAFHDLKALPTIKVNKSCNCQLCITQVQYTIQEMKQQLEKLSDEKAEGSTGSSAENKSRVGPESVSSFEFP